DVVRVDQQRGALTQRCYLAGERGGLVVMDQGVGMGGSASGRDAVAAPGRQVGGGRETRQVGGAGSGDRGFLVGPPGAHFDQCPPPGGGDHPRSGGGDRAVVIENRENQGFQHHTFGERAGDREDRRA